MIGNIKLTTVQTILPFSHQFSIKRNASLKYNSYSNSWSSMIFLTEINEIHKLKHNSDQHSTMKLNCFKTFHLSLQNSSHSSCDEEKEFDLVKI